MVGGIVIGITRYSTHQRIMVRGEGCEQNDTLCVNGALCGDVLLGDSIWWQCGNLYWGRKGQFRDFVIPKIGYSHSSGRLVEA